MIRLPKDNTLKEMFREKAVERIAEAKRRVGNKLMESLPANASVKDYIDDFQKSDNPKFAGKSQDERRKQAIAAWYSKHEEVSPYSGAPIKKESYEVDSWVDDPEDEEDPENSKSDIDWQAYKLGPPVKKEAVASGFAGDVDQVEEDANSDKATYDAHRASCKNCYTDYPLVFGDPQPVDHECPEGKALHQKYLAALRAQSGIKEAIIDPPRPGTFTLKTDVDGKKDTVKIYAKNSKEAINKIKQSLDSKNPDATSISVEIEENINEDVSFQVGNPVRVIDRFDKFYGMHGKVVSVDDEDDDDPFGMDNYLVQIGDKMFYFGDDQLVKEGINEEYSVGDKVKVKSSGKTGEVIYANSGSVEVKFDNNHPARSFTNDQVVKESSEWFSITWDGMSQGHRESLLKGAGIEADKTLASSSYGKLPQSVRDKLETSVQKEGISEEEEEDDQELEKYLKADEKKDKEEAAEKKKTVKEDARPLSQIASDIRKDWKKVNYAATPYLSALADLDSINDNYGADSGRSIVSYFLSNASGWTGENARKIKSELKAMLREAVEYELVGVKPGERRVTSQGTFSTQSAAEMMAISMKAAGWTGVLVNPVQVKGLDESTQFDTGDLEGTPENKKPFIAPEDECVQFENYIMPRKKFAHVREHMKVRAGLKGLREAKKANA